MIALASAAAVLLYLAPLVALVAARWRRDTELWEIALDIPLAVSLDLLFVLALTRFMPLHTAALSSRPVSIALIALYVLVRKRRSGAALAWPKSLHRRDLFLIALAALAAVLVSLTLSRPYNLWDRHWHTPLVASIRGQPLPFHNVFGADQELHYHFSGNVLAAVLQTFSFATIHSSLALSLAHDVLFGLTGATAALLLRGFGARRAALILVALLGILMSGPHTMLLGGASRPEGGYSYLSFLVMSFRPHVSVAALMLLGFVGSILVRLRAAHRPIPVLKTAPALLATTALLAISDEASIGICGLALGLTWLIEPDVVAPKRLHGVALFIGLLLALIAPNLAFAASLSLSPSATGMSIRLVPWRTPGFYNPTLPLTTAKGQLMLAVDFLPVLMIWVVGFLRLLRVRTRPFFASLILLTGILLVSAFMLTKVEVDKSAYEAHRFMTAISFLAPIFGLAWLGRWPDYAPLPRPSPLSLILVIGAMGLSVAATIDWIQGIAPKPGHKHDVHLTKRNLYEVNCRKEVSATALDRPQHHYIPKPFWYMVAGCRPIFGAGKAGGHWDIKVGPPIFEHDGLAVLHRALGPSPLTAVCPTDPSETDPICVYAQSHAQCAPLGKAFVRCELTPAQRSEILANRPRTPPPSKEKR